MTASDFLQWVAVQEQAEGKVMKTTFHRSNGTCYKSRRSAALQHFGRLRHDVEKAVLQVRKGRD